MMLTHAHDVPSFADLPGICPLLLCNQSLFVFVFLSSLFLSLLLRAFLVISGNEVLLLSMAIL